MSTCYAYNLDNVFKRFQVMEFPISFIGLSTTRELDVETDLNVSAYIKTNCDGQLMKFNEAYEVSASHRAFFISLKDSHTLEITFTPKNECISKSKHCKNFDNRFVFDLRLIRVDGSYCCYDELHSEIGRYYISGKFEDLKIFHSPDIVNFGTVKLSTKMTKYIRIRNESSIMCAKMQYIRVAGFKVTPEKFTVLPNKSIKITITIKPTSLKLKNIIQFKIINPHDSFAQNVKDNFIAYYVHFKLNVIIQKSSKELTIESMHKIKEQDCGYTYIGHEFVTRQNRKKTALKYLEMSKMSHAKVLEKDKYTTDNERCHLSSTFTVNNKPYVNFCEILEKSVSIYDVLLIRFVPFQIDFGRVGLSTYGEKSLLIQNSTNYNIALDLLEDDYILYTEDKLVAHKIKLKSLTEVYITIFCHGYIEGNFEGTFKYIINKTFYRKHNYTLQVGTPKLMVNEKSLKFGMVTSESFITSVPLRIYNDFNVPVNFKWDDLHPETPFEIIPDTGTIPKHSCKVCDVLYVCKATKMKTHEVNLLSISTYTRFILPLELSVVTRKLSIKFLQAAVVFKDIALNMETIEQVKLENSSREIALFYVVEPLIPGLTINPMIGSIRPKMVMSFDVIVKIPCVLEFAFDIYVKINNKENVVLPVSGNVVEPRIIVHPRNIYMTRVPCEMITYVPVTFQNLSNLKTVVDVLDTGDENIFSVFVAQGNEKKRVFRFIIDGGQLKTVFIKIYDIFRREYEMYIPFKINNLLGPPNSDTCSSELKYYIEEFSKSYENNSRVKLKTLSKDISFCRIAGVITVPWICFSVEKFEIDYVPQGDNIIDFTMTNVSKYILQVTILTSKLGPIFSLDVNTEKHQSIINDSQIKFQLDLEDVASFTLKFNPKGHGRFVSVALLYLDKHMTIPYYNLTFVGKRQVLAMIPDSYRIIFAPCNIGEKYTRIIIIKMEGQSKKELFSCNSKEEPNLKVEIVDANIVQEEDIYFTIVTVLVTVSCTTCYARNIMLNFQHNNGSGCEVEICFCFTYCALTLHTLQFVKPEDNPYPYYPQTTQNDLFNYMETCTAFLEKWMFQQGFRRDLYPKIPDTFHAISSTLTSQQGPIKSKGINVSYLNFMRRIAGPLMKHIRKISVTGVDDSFKCVKEIHDTYREIINLLKSRGANLWILQAKFLLSYDQFLIFSDHVTPKYNADIIFTQELKDNATLFERLNKQSWFDFILQSYKVFVMDSCFFECICMSSQPRDIVKILINWYNENIALQHRKLRGKDKALKVVTNITTDLSDGIALISVILNYCPFMEKHFLFFFDVDEHCNEGDIIHNACLIIEATNLLRLYFPVTSKDFLHPNFILMLFLSIHFYITLPMFKAKDTIKFNPPLLRSSSRQVAISPTSQESLIFNYILLNNSKNNFSVEKASSADNGKKMNLGVKYVANFVEKEEAILLVHGYNKTRIFDTYIVFLLIGHVGSLNPVRKCKVTGPLYRPNKVDILVASPFLITAVYSLYLTDEEPTIPVSFENNKMSKFCVKRLSLIDKEVMLLGLPKETGQDVPDHKLHLQMMCLNTQIGNCWIWFRSEVGEFFVRVTSQPRWDLAIDTLQTKVRTWPMDPCSCGEACECFRTTVLMIPHRNELMLKSLRYAINENASEVMIQVYDQLIETATGKIILGMLLEEGGTNLSEVQHILRSDTTYRITSKALLPRLDRATLSQHTGAFLALPVTIPAHDKAEKYTVTFTSECGMDIRIYRILFIESLSE